MFEPARRRCWLPALLSVACLTAPAVGTAVPDDEPEPLTPAYTPPSPRDPSVPPPPPPSPIDVELELALLVDVSNSVDDKEFELQRRGYVDAFRDPDIQAAIVALDGVAVSYWEWSSGSQRTQFGWRLLKNEADCEQFADLVSVFGRNFRHSTNMATALNAAMRSTDNNRYISQRQVIDVSGDGICENEYTNRIGGDASALGAPWLSVIGRRPATMTINGISIGSAADVIDWYDTTVPQGSGAFTMNASTFEEFGDAIKQKLLREIEATPISYD